MTHTVKTAFATRIAAIACAAAAFAAAPALAADMHRPRDTVNFKYRPEALSNHAGRVETLKRLERSVARACDTYRTGKIHDMREREACRRELTQSLLGQINDARLTALSEQTSRVAGRAE